MGDRGRKGHFRGSLAARFAPRAASFPSYCFGWDVGEGRRRDSEGGQPGPEEVAERPSQSPNGSAARLRKLFSRDERAWSAAPRGGAN